MIVGMLAPEALVPHLKAVSTKPEYTSVPPYLKLWTAQAAQRIEDLEAENSALRAAAQEDDR